MKAVCLGMICAGLLAYGTSLVLAPLAISASTAYTTEGVRLSEH